MADQEPTNPEDSDCIPIQLDAFDVSIREYFRNKPFPFVLMCEHISNPANYF